MLTKIKNNEIKFQNGIIYVKQISVNVKESTINFTVLQVFIMVIRLKNNQKLEIEFGY